MKDLVHLNVKGSTSFPLSGSDNVNVSLPSTWLDAFPNEHDPVLVTLLWYSFRHSRKNVWHGVEHRLDMGERWLVPQHWPVDSSLRGLAISSTWSSKMPEPCVHCNNVSSRKNCKRKYPSVMLLHNNLHTTLHIITATVPAGRSHRVPAPSSQYFTLPPRQQSVPDTIKYLCLKLLLITINVIS